MKVSIVTVVYNGERFIESAIRSVLSQDYPNIEYIIIDGQSNDRTLEIIKRYGDRISKFVSEEDKGLYDAMNKGISMATGELLGVLNADDFYRSDSIISQVVDKVKMEGVDSIYGDLIYVDPVQTNRIRRIWKSGVASRKGFLYGWMPPHPTFFVKRWVYEKYGMFNINLKSAADYEFMLRVLYKFGISVSYIPEVITVMRDGGLSNASLKNRFKGNQEDALAWKLNELKPFFFTRILKPLRKITQYFHLLRFKKILSD